MLPPVQENSKLMSLSIIQMNNLFTQIGEQSFNQILIMGGKEEDLTADIFRKQVEEALRASNS